MTIPDLDDRLISLLRQNARQSTANLARKLGVARSTVQKRIEGLEKSGRVQGYTVVVGESGAGETIRAHVMIRVNPKMARRVERALRAMGEITALYSVSGDYDLIAVAATDNTTAMDRVLDEIRELDGVKETNSSVILSTRIQRR